MLPPTYGLCIFNDDIPVLLCDVTVFIQRRATAADCLKHPWLKFDAEENGGGVSLHDGLSGGGIGATITTDETTPALAVTDTEVNSRGMEGGSAGGDGRDVRVEETTDGGFDVHGLPPSSKREPALIH